MKASIPGLDDIVVAVPQASTRRLDLKMEGGFVIPADSSSAGTRAADLAVRRDRKRTASKTPAGHREGAS